MFPFDDDDFPYSVSFISSTGLSSATNALIWCQETFGNNKNEDDGWRVILGMASTRFVFKHEKDFLLFKLRWL